MRIPLFALLRGREEFNQPSLPVLTVTSEHGVAIRDLTAGGRALGDDLAAYRVVRTGDLVVNRLWARFGAYGVSPVDGIISPAYWVLKVDGGRVHDRYLHHLLRSESYLSEIRRVSKDMPPNGYDLPWNQFRRIGVELPDLDEQRAIADFLDAETARIEVLVNKWTLLRAKLDEQLDSTITTALTHADAPEIPTRFLACLLVSSVDKKSNPSEAPVRLCNYTDVYKNDEITNDLDFMKATATPAEVATYSLQEDDVLFTKDSESSNDIAVPAYVPNSLPDVVCGYHLALLRPDRTRASGRYLYWALRSSRVRDQFAHSANGVTRFGLRQDLMKRVLIPMPSLEVQRAVCTTLNARASSTRHLCRLIDRQVALLEERKKALVTRAVSGDLEITRGGQ
jgi:type I restriction enzyme S subunit